MKIKTTTWKYGVLLKWKLCNTKCLISEDGFQMNDLNFHLKKLEQIKPEKKAIKEKTKSDREKSVTPNPGSLEKINKIDKSLAILIERIKYILINERIRIQITNTGN